MYCAETYWQDHSCLGSGTEEAPDVIAAAIAEIRLLTAEFEAALAREVELERTLDEQRSQLRGLNHNREA